MRKAVLAALTIGLLMATGKIILAQSVTIKTPVLDQTLVASNNQTLSFEGDGKPKVITGNNNRVQIHGDCSSLKVLGNGNSVEVERVGDIQMIGNANHVSYLHTLNGESPTVANIGRDNEAKQVGSLGSPNAAASAAPEDNGEIEVVTLTNDNLTRTITKKHVKLVGSNNSVVFNGVAEQLDIDGSNNDIEIDQVTKVVFHGSNNDVSYKQSLSSGEEVVSEAHGSNNDVEKAD